MRTFGLDAPYGGEESAVSQFEVAIAAFARPPVANGPATPSLLALRSCIVQTIEALNKRKPVQEATGRSDADKIRSIGRQVGRPGCSLELVESWANDWAQLNDALSGAKTKAFSRDRCESLIDSGSLFLRSFLAGLDPDKLRERRTP